MSKCKKKKNNFQISEGIFKLSPPLLLVQITNETTKKDKDYNLKNKLSSSCFLPCVIP